MYGLEHALYFGVPDNKIELLEGGSRWAFPFASRKESEAHFHAWIETIRPWKQVKKPTPIRKSGETWKANVNGIKMELFPRPIDMRFPISPEAFRAFHRTFNRRDFWPGQPKGLETGWDSVWDEGDIRMNLWSLFTRLSEKHGGRNNEATARRAWRSSERDGVWSATLFLVLPKWQPHWSIGYFPCQAAAHAIRAHTRY